MEMLGPDMPVPGENDGLPRQPDVAYYLWIRANTTCELIKSRQGLQPLAAYETPRQTG